MNASKLVIVDKNDTILGVKDKKDMLPDDIYRVSAVWVKNSQGDILLAQRSFDKSKDPGKWGPGAAGTIEEGETYDSNIVKEIEEELGIEVTLDDLEKSILWFNDEPGNPYFGQWYILVTDKSLDEFTIQKEEVEQIKWFTREELTRELENNPDDFLRNTNKWLNEF